LLLFLTSITSFSQKKTPKNIIFLIGDGMGVSQVYTGNIANKGHLNIERSQFIGFHKNRASDDFVTDSGAGDTAFSISKKTYNGAMRFLKQTQPKEKL
jgi:alkaline phosphatase